MKNLHKKSLLFAAAGLIVATNISATELANYNQIASAVTAGKSIRIVTTFAKCKMSNGNKVPYNSIGSFEPKAIAVYNGAVAASSFHFTMENPVAPQGTYEWALYKIDQNNELNLTVKFLNPVNFAPLSPPLNVICKLGSGVNVYD